MERVRIPLEREQVPPDADEFRLERGRIPPQARTLTMGNGAAQYED
jgi:hypothetical protein